MVVSVGVLEACMNGNVIALLRSLVFYVTLVVVSSLSSTVNAQNIPQQTYKPTNIDRNTLLVLVKGSLIALDQANKTGNYSVLKDLGAPQFQNNTNADLAMIFAQPRKDKLNLDAAIILDPQFTAGPEINAEGMLHVSGYFPTVPKQIEFNLFFIPVQGQWRLFGIGAGIPNKESSSAGPNKNNSSPEKK